VLQIVTTLQKHCPEMKQKLKFSTNLFFYLDCESALMNIDKIKEILIIQNAKIVFCVSKNTYSDRTHDIFKEIPIFNGDNRIFFENNVFIHENDLDETKLTPNQVVKNMAINTFYYEKVILLPMSSHIKL